MEDQNVPPQENPQPPQENTQETQPVQTDSNERTWTIFCHLSGLLLFTSIPFANVIGPLVIWLIKKDEMPKVNEHGKAALNFQISMTIYALACIPLFLIVIGFFLLMAVGIVNIIFIIVASVNASNGKLYKYPLSINFIK